MKHDIHCPQSGASSHWGCRSRGILCQTAGPAGLTQLLAWAALLLGCIVAAPAQRTQAACQRVYLDSSHDEPAHEGPKIACKCTDSACDSKLEFHWPQDDSSLVSMISNEAGARFELNEMRLDTAGQKPSEAQYHVQVSVNKRFQQVAGYGGAFTDSASMLIRDKLTVKCREHLMASYFSPTGLNYNLARVPIAGTDMSWRPYSYNDLPEGQEDLQLSGFKLQEEDLVYKLPLIREANSLRPPSGGPLKLLATSWSAPKWMKSNQNLVQGRLKDGGDDHDDHDDETDTTKGKYYDAYARYIIKFMDEYERQLSGANGSSPGQFHIWALTPQNEPCTPDRLGHSVVNYNSVNFSPVQMSRFIRLHLVPNLLRSNRTARELALFLWDDTLVCFNKYKEHLFEPLTSSSSSSVASSSTTLSRGHGTHTQVPHKQQEFTESQINDYVRGLALHWYSQGLDKLPYKVLYDLRRWLPAKYSMISTEASFIGTPRPGDWRRGEKYARDIIGNLRSGSVGWIDWNLALNLEGGPSWSRNFLDAAVLVDEHAGTFLKSPMFYAIGHLSRFIRANSYIIESQVRARELARNSSAPPPPPTGASWRLIDEIGEQTSDLLVVASELEAARETQTGCGAVGEGGPQQGWRRIALVLLNRSASTTRVKVSVLECKSRVGQLHASPSRPLELELSAKSITSLAFNC